MLLMKMIRYACTHCGRKFEAEEKEILECPGCFWSTSVKREDELTTEGAAPASAAKRTSQPLSFKPLIRSALMTAGVLLAAAALFAWGIPALRKITKPKAGSGISLPLPDALKNKKSSAPKNTVPETAPAAYTLTAEDLNLLARRVQLTADRALLPEEEQVLKNKAGFRTGISEKLPSQPWNLENFKQMIEEQERFYQVPLPGSYKKKLYTLFNAKYAAADEPFKNGDLLQARNFWVEALAFPVYADNPQKHKGVALTMLRPFITDTLSKIGAVNGTLIERTIRGKEQAISTSYNALFQLLEQKNWAEASAAIAKLQQDLAAFSQPGQLTGTVPPYPEGIRQVDPDIQATLFELLKAPPPATADLGAMQRDIDAKKKVVDSFSAENFQAIQRSYDEALDLINQKKWQEAAVALKKIQSPLPLAQDAQEKVKILSRMPESQLDSEPKQR
jgi:predicted  nucleic acid-binding Zn-ribbon protein